MVRTRSALRALWRWPNTSGRNGRRSIYQRESVWRKSGSDPDFSTFEELLHFVEPGLGARVVARAVLLGDRLELAQQLALALGEADRRFHHHVAEQVTRQVAAHALDAFAFQAEGLAGLRLGRHADVRRAVQRRDADVAAERRGAERNRHLAVQVVVVALEHRVRLDVHLDIEVAGRAAVDTGLAFAGQAHAVALVDAGRDPHRKRLLQLDASRAAAGGAGIRDDAATAVAAWAGLRDGERTLRHPHLPGAAAGRAGGRLRAGPCAAALATVAQRHAWDADLGLEAVRRLLERDLEVVAQVGATVHGAASAARASAAEDLAENVAEDVAEAAHARGSGAHAGLRIDAGVAELVVG